MSNRFRLLCLDDVNELLERYNGVQKPFPGLFSGGAKWTFPSIDDLFDAQHALHALLQRGRWCIFSISANTPERTLTLSYHLIETSVPSRVKKSKSNSSWAERVAAWIEDQRKKMSSKDFPQWLNEHAEAIAASCPEYDLVTVQEVIQPFITAIPSQFRGNYPRLINRKIRKRIEVQSDTV